MVSASKGAAGIVLCDPPEWHAAHLLPYLLPKRLSLPLLPPLTEADTDSSEAEDQIETLCTARFNRSTEI